MFATCAAPRDSDSPVEVPSVVNVAFILKGDPTLQCPLDGEVPQHGSMLPERMSSSESCFFLRNGVSIC